MTMSVKTNGGIVPMDADVLMLGVVPDEFDFFQRSIKGGFQSMHMGWSYVANLAQSSKHAVEFIANRPSLDIVYITNRVNRTRQELQDEVTKLLIPAMQKHPYEPWVSLDNDTLWLKPFFDEAGITAICACVTIVATERHRFKCKLAEGAAHAA
jgi:hypothetical protein